MRFALIDGGAGGAVGLIAGRCVGGSTTINTKVALRAHAKDYAKWHDASGMVGSKGAPFGASDLEPHYDQVEKRLGVRERSDWRKSVRTVEPAFRALGAPLEPVMSYTDGNCMSCGSCLQGCPTNAGKSTLNTYIHDAWAMGRLELRADARVDRIVIEDGEAAGIITGDNQRGFELAQRIESGIVHVNARRSGTSRRCRSAASRTRAGVASAAAPRSRSSRSCVG
jgi:choline dehydrogenase-like flavoprotein